jgi:hypothetical protein
MTKSMKAQPARAEPHPDKAGTSADTEDTCIGLWDRVSLSGISDTILIRRGEAFWVPCDSLNVGSCQQGTLRSPFDVHACWMKSPKVVAGIHCPSGLRILGMWCSCSMKLTISVLGFSDLSHRKCFVPSSFMELLLYEDC